MTLEQVLKNISSGSAARSKIAGAFAHKGDDEKKSLEMQILKQRIAGERSPLGTELNSDINIFTPEGLETARKVAAMRSGTGSAVEERAVREMETLKNPFATPDQRSTAQAYLDALPNIVEQRDTGALDRVISGRSKSWQDIMEARPYLTERQFDEAKIPWIERQRDLRRETYDKGKDIGRLEDKTEELVKYAGNIKLSDPKMQAVFVPILAAARDELEGTKPEARAIYVKRTTEQIIESINNNTRMDDQEKDVAIDWAAKELKKLGSSK